MGCLAGGAIVQTLGAEMTASNWKWLFDRCAELHLISCTYETLYCSPAATADW